MARPPDRACIAIGEQTIAFETLSYDVADGIALITLNRPARMNAINKAMSAELPQMWRLFDNDPSARVAIVTGAGDRAFCTGADVADLPEMILDDEGNALPESVLWTPLQNKVWKPVICAVNGMVMGGGLHFVAECDVVIASEDAVIADPHVSIGLVSALETIALARRIPIGTVLRLALGGRDERLSARRAHDLGMFDEICPPGEVLNRARVLAMTMARNSPSAMARTKCAIWSSKEHGLGEATTRAWSLMNRQNRSPDYAEGVNAFNERREPRWAAYDPASLNTPSREAEA
ncbi:MAG: enoyl-CoA hydratase-related protein [Blastomonas sp.]